MGYSLAASQLARVIHMTGIGSLARAIDEGKLNMQSQGPEDDAVLARVKSIAEEEKLVHEEAKALAATRGWKTNIAGAPYGWDRLKGETPRGALPRLVRIFDREVFELEGLAREEHKDDDVRSLVLATLDGRHAVLSELQALSPAATLPGAK